MTKPSGVIEYKHSILAGSEAVAIRTLRSNGTNDTRYLQKDHLGSVDALTNEAGSVVTKLSYDAFGKRRSPTTWSGSPSAGDWTNIAGITHRGYTEHEQLDNVDLIHMNGRVYDSVIGRFTSADPFVPDAFDPQSFNRYSYARNRPLSRIDRLGFMDEVVVTAPRTNNSGGISGLGGSSGAELGSRGGNGNTVFAPPRNETRGIVGTTTAPAATQAGPVLAAAPTTDTARSPMNEAAPSPTEQKWTRFSEHGTRLG